MNKKLFVIPKMWSFHHLLALPCFQIAVKLESNQTLVSKRQGNFKTLKKKQECLKYSFEICSVMF